jgi:hypothetical protein
VAFLFLPVVTMAVGVGLPLGALMLATSVLPVARVPPILVMVAFAVAILGGGGLGLVAGLALPYRALKRHAAAARHRAREVLAGIDLVSPAVCPRCGGHASVVVTLGPVDPSPCPWCGGALLPPAGWEAVREAVAGALRRQDPGLAERFLDSLGRQERPGRSAPRLAGFELGGGGAVVAGSIDGIALRAFNEVVDGVFVLRVEAHVDTRLSGEAWLVRPGVEAALRLLATEWGYAMPEEPAASPRPGWNAYATEPVPWDAAVGDALDRLGADDALLLDPAGLSWWRRASGLSRSWSLLEEQHANMVALARALRAAPD